jgi:3',5'-cyclic AMP phosphodiesterase CpdA
MKLLILHLSDIHIRSQRDAILSKAPEIVAATASRAFDVEHIFVALTGDIAFSGASAEYVAANEFLTTLKTELCRESRLPVDIVLTPGNHDCDFRSETATRRLLIRSILESELTFRTSRT